MRRSNQGRTVLVNGKLYERRADGSLVPLVGQTDFRRLDAMTDEEVEANALSDPDALPMTDAGRDRGILQDVGSGFGWIAMCWRGSRATARAISRGSMPCCENIWSLTARRVEDPKGLLPQMLSRLPVAGEGAV